MPCVETVAMRLSLAERAQDSRPGVYPRPGRRASPKGHGTGPSSLDYRGWFGGRARRCLVPVFEASQVVRCPVEEAFAFFRDPANLVRASPPELNMRLVEGPAQLHLG